MGRAGLGGVEVMEEGGLSSFSFNSYGKAAKVPIHPAVTEDVQLLKAGVPQTWLKSARVFEGEFGRGRSERPEARSLLCLTSGDHQDHTAGPPLTLRTEPGGSRPVAKTWYPPSPPRCLG